MFDPLQRADFDRLGFVRLPGLLPEDAVRGMARSLWSYLAEHRGILREDPSTWSPSRPSKLKALTRSDAFAGLASPAVLALLDQLFGPGGWHPPRHWGQPVVWLPARRAAGAAGGGWDVPHKSWHLDIPVGGAGGLLPGVRLFALLEPVEARGGATVVVTGSHRLAQEAAQDAGGSEPLSSEQMRRAFMRSSPWMCGLLSGQGKQDRQARFMDAPHAERGVELQVVELTGGAGDVIAMDLRLLHAAAPNCAARPRVVLGQAILRKSEEAAA